MKKQKKPDNPALILAALKKHRYSLRMIEGLLESKTGYVIHYSQLSRIASGKSVCSDDCAEALRQLARILL